jgi:GNAT superfamily N-acetyltransferase
MAAVYCAAAREGWVGMYPAVRLASLTSPVARLADEAKNSEPRRAAIVAELAGQVVGFAIARPSEDDDADPRSIGELDMMYAHPSVWGTGVAQALMSAVLSELRAAGFSEATLATDERNLRPRRFYETAGWRLDGASKDKVYLGVPFRELRYRIAL